MVNHLYGRRCEVILTGRNNKKTYFTYRQRLGHDFAIDFDCPSDDSGTAPVSTITMHNLSSAHRNLFEKGLHVVLKAGYAEDGGQQTIAEGTIRAVNPVTQDAGSDSFSFTFRSGEEYADALSSSEKAAAKAKQRNKHLKAQSANGKYKKVKARSNLSFAKNSSATTVIRRIAADAGIKISRIYLKKKVKFKKGYTASGKPFANIQKIAKQCKSRAYYVRGSLVIDDLSKEKGRKVHVWITDHIKGEHGGSGLISYPTLSDSSGKKKALSFDTLLIPEVVTGSVVRLDCRGWHGTYRVKSVHIAGDSSNWKQTVEVYL